ncbi:hypothetical protein SDC9_181234 [bioreactor metagenome]|uniref:Uncharacterized protein n=1 Tax=bioreactor metagenome TaxID=1076179 RepID=A0A645HD89_9ZZZZ
MKNTFKKKRKTSESFEEIKETYLISNILLSVRRFM